MTNNTELNELQAEQKVTFKERWAQIKEDYNNPAKKKVRRRKVGFAIGKFFRFIILLGLCFVILLPIFEKISFAFRHPVDIANPLVVWIPENWSVVNIQIAYKLLDYSHSFWNTLLLSTLCMVIQIIACAVAGYSFGRLKFKGQNILFVIMIFTLVVPNDTLNISRMLLFTNTKFLGINLMGNVLSIYIMSIFCNGIRSAIFVFLFRQAFRGVPIELEESAQVDGAGVIRTFWSVMLPNVRGTIVTVGLFAFVWQWNDYYFAQLFNLSSANFPVLSVKLTGGTEQLFNVIQTWIMGDDPYFKTITMESIRNNNLFYGLISNTAALLMMLPLLIGYFFVQKQFVESIERTGIVG